MEPHEAADGALPKHKSKNVVNLVARDGELALDLRERVWTLLRAGYRVRDYVTYKDHAVDKGQLSQAHVECLQDALVRHGQKVFRSPDFLDDWRKRRKDEGRARGGKAWSTSMEYNGLIAIDHERDENSGNKHGHCHITDLGVAFAHDRVSIPRYTRTYDGKVLRTEGPNIFAHEVTGEYRFYDQEDRNRP